MDRLSGGKMILQIVVLGTLLPHIYERATKKKWRNFDLQHKKSFVIFASKQMHPDMQDFYYSSGPKKERLVGI